MSSEENNPAPPPASSEDAATPKPKRRPRKPVEAGPDIFDEQAALREQEQQSATQSLGSQVESGQNNDVSNPAKPELGHNVERIKFPDPFGTHNIALTADKDGPRMHLSRSSRFRQMRIAFDAKPSEETLQLLRDNGFRGNNEHKAWTIQLERGAESAHSCRRRETIQGDRQRHTRE